MAASLSDVGVSMASRKDHHQRAADTSPAGGRRMREQPTSSSRLHDREQWDALWVPPFTRAAEGEAVAFVGEHFQACAWFSIPSCMAASLSDVGVSMASRGDHHQRAADTSPAGGRRMREQPTSSSRLHDREQWDALWVPPFTRAAEGEAVAFVGEQWASVASSRREAPPSEQ
ncbi:hypothetical protein Dimus_023125 [Dionaea muscipula]